jgi:phenylacetaldehyde dehydrogenase
MSEKLSLLEQAPPMYVGGKFIGAAGDKRYPVFDPATNAEIALVPDASEADVDSAVLAARRAFDGGAWPAMGGTRRGRLLWRLADLIDAHCEEISALEALNNGMPVAFARMASVGRAAAFLRYHAGWADKLTGDTLPMEDSRQRAWTVREPVGVVGAIVPWNVPFVNAVAKVAHALAAGCTLVLKVSEQTPLTAILLARLIDEAGFPPGVFNLVTGKGRLGPQALVAHPLVDKISFTGSTAVGKKIMEVCAVTMKRVSLELGGKSPVIILPDADIDQAATAAAAGIFANAGQVCIAGSRAFVHASIYDQVVAAMLAKAEKLRVGPASDPASEMGPLVTSAHLERVLDYCALGKREGARLLTGGERRAGAGNFVAPTIFAEIGPAATIQQEEIFGPVLVVNRFNDDDLETIARAANDTPFGLSANIWSGDVGRALKLAHLIRSGTVRINGGAGFDPAVPFGGFKQSGLGRENGPEGIKAYTELKSITVTL